MVTAETPDDARGGRRKKTKGDGEEDAANRQHEECKARGKEKERVTASGSAASDLDIGEAQRTHIYHERRRKRLAPKPATPSPELSNWSYYLDAPPAGRLFFPTGSLTGGLI
jgi:hypothetical protein